MFAALRVTTDAAGDGTQSSPAMEDYGPPAVTSGAEAHPLGAAAGINKLRRGAPILVPGRYAEASKQRRSLNTEEEAMLKTSIAAAFLAAFALSPAYAADDLCTAAHMKQMDGMIAKMSDAAKKKEATMHLDMSKAEMQKGNTAGCMKHMAEAHKAMGL